MRKGFRSSYTASLIGQTFNNLTVLDIDVDNKAKCQCTCGNITTRTSLYNLTRGKVKSCKSCSGKINGAKGNQTKSKGANKNIGKKFNYFTILSKATVEEAGKSGKYKCQCICGKIVCHDLYTLKNTTGKGAKSCGCQQSRLLSLAGGGTGIAYETSTTNNFIRKGNKLYDDWVKTCLERADYTCAVSGIRGGKLNVHHIVPLHKLIKQFNITIENYLEFSDILFDISNGVVLAEEVHKQFHSEYGNTSNVRCFLEFKHNYKKSRSVILS